MDFRWVVAIALWTILVGPIVGVPRGPASKSAPPAKAVKAKAALPRR
jgi:hypothetical protein